MYLLLMGEKGIRMSKGSLEDCFMLKHIMETHGFYYLWVTSYESVVKYGTKL